MVGRVCGAAPPPRGITLAWLRHRTLITTIATKEYTEMTARAILTEVFFLIFQITDSEV